MIVDHETADQLVGSLERYVRGHYMRPLGTEDSEDSFLLHVVVVNDEVGRRWAEMEKAAVVGSDAESGRARLLTSSFAAFLKKDLGRP